MSESRLSTSASTAFDLPMPRLPFMTTYAITIPDEGRDEERFVTTGMDAHFSTISDTTGAAPV
jgi:hypothetical protein